jgi:cytochrome P450
MTLVGTSADGELGGRFGHGPCRNAGRPERRKAGTPERRKAGTPKAHVRSQHSGVRPPVESLRPPADVPGPRSAQSRHMDRLPTYDVLSLSSLEDPYPLFAEWRAAGPLMNGVYGWGVTRHAEVTALLRDRRVGHVFPDEMLAVPCGTGPLLEFQSRSILNRDGANHMRLRRLMGQAFTAPLVRRLRDHIAGLVDDLIEPLLDGQPVDIVESVSHPLPSMVICELLGIDPDDRDIVGVHASRFATGDPALADTEVLWLREYMGHVLDGRRPDAEGDLFERMLAAEDGADRLSHAEIVDNAAFLFFAGFETTKHLITSGTALLVEFPDQQARLWADPSLAASAVEEFLRFDPPLRTVPRITLEPVDIGGRVIKPGRFLQLLLGSANRDERAFEHPDRLDIERTPNPHVSFASGVHFCLGAMLARVEATVVFERLAERTAAIEEAGPATRRAGPIGTYDAVPVRLGRRAASVAVR